MSSSGSSFDVSFLNQKRLVHLFNGFCFFANGGSDGAQTNGPSFELFYDGQQNPVVHFVQSILIDIKRL